MRARISHGFFRRHPGQLQLALAGIAAGMAVVTGVALLRAALVDSLDAASAELAGGDAIVVRAPDGPLPTDRYAELSQRPGSPDWVPVQRIPVRAGETRLEVIGVDPFSAVRNVAAGSTATIPAAGLQWSGTGPPPAAIGASTLQLLGVDDGQPLAVEGPNGSVELIAVGVGGGADRRLVMDIAVARSAFGIDGGLTELLAPGAARSWIDRHLPSDLIAIPLDQQRASARKLTEGLRANLTAMSLLALATGLFVVYAVLSFLVVQRRRTFGVLRAIGMTHRDLARMLAQEGLVLGALGSLIGLVAGTLLADLLLGLLADPVRSIYGQLALARTEPTPGLYATLFGLGMAAAIAVTVPVVLEALRVPPGRILRDRGRKPQGRQHLSVILSLFLVLAGGLWVALDSRLIAALGGLFLVLAGIALRVPPLGFGLLSRAAVVLGRGLPGRSIGLLAGSRTRLAPALSALSLALALAMGMGMMILGFRVAVDDWVQRLLRADLYVSAPDRRLAPDEIEQLANLAEVADVSTVRGVQLVDGTRLTVYSLPPEAWAGFEWLAVDGDLDTLRTRFEGGQGVAISEPLSRSRSLEAGDGIELALPEGERTLPVLGVFRDYSSDAGFVAADAELAAGWLDDLRNVDSVGLYLQPGLDSSALERALGADSRFAALRWIGPDDIRAESLAVFDRTFRISWAMAVLVGGIALLALVSALLAHGLERAREYATLRALGLEPNRLFTMVVIQTLGLTVAAAALAVPVALLVHYSLALLIQPRAFGWSVPAALPPIEPILIVVPAALLCGALAGVLPAARITRRQPSSALRGR